jgi:predicted transcriptional regulator of viral defense system
MTMPVKKGYLKDLLRSRQTVFTFRELMLLWGGIDSKTARARVHYYIKNNQLYHLRRGLYAISSSSDKFELATRIFSPSYISFETVLGSNGITFQYYNRIFIASYQSKDVECDKNTFTFKTIKRTILTDSNGIENREFYAIASPERAFLDVVYLNTDYHFDNLSSLDWDKIFSILPVFGGNRRMEQRVKKYHETFKHNH